MRRIGTTIAGVRARHEARAIRGDINRPGARDVKNAQAIERLELQQDTSGVEVIPSSPATFSVDETAQTENLTFAIPAGTFASGTWNEQGSTDNNDTYTDRILTPTNSAAFATHGSGAFDSSVAVTAAQLADINAAAGGNLAAVFSGETDSVPPEPISWITSITALTLTLVETGGQVYELFVFGLHPMDGTADITVRYIP